MTLAIDKAGRVILPKPVRDRLGLHPGTKLEMHVEADGEIRLKLKSVQPALESVGGVLVHRGEPSSDLDWNAVLNQSRDERMSTLASGLFE